MSTPMRRSPTAPIFLERLGAVDRERNKTALAIAAYQKMIELGGEQAARGYQNQVDTWREAKQYDKAVEVAQKALRPAPGSRVEAGAGRRADGLRQDR